jgi:hypothetical protein
MIRGKTVLALSVAAALAVGGALYIQHQDTQRTGSFAEQGQRLYPELGAKLNDVAQIDVTAAGQTVTLKREQDRWVIVERGNYPADMGKVRSLLLGTAELTLLEPKTANPELFSQLGLDDAGKTDAQSTLVTLKDTQGNTVAAVVFGKQRPGKGSLERSEHYVRKLDSNQSWLVEGSVQLQKRAADWIDKMLLNIDAQRVKQVAVTHAADQSRLLIAKDNRDATDFKVLEPASDKPLTSAFEVNNIANTFARLSIDDVKPAAEVDFSNQPSYTAELETFDGLKVTMDVATADGKPYARLKAQAVPVPAAAEAAPIAAPAGETGDAAEATKPVDATKQAESAKTPPVDVTKEVSEIGARSSAWAFLLPSFQSDILSKKAEDLFQKPGETDREGEHDDALGGLPDLMSPEQSSQEMPLEEGTAEEESFEGDEPATPAMPEPQAPSSGDEPAQGDAQAESGAANTPASP